MTLDRRSFLTACSGAGITSALFPGILYTLAAQAEEPAYEDQSKPPKITPEMIDAAAVMAGIGPFSAEQKQMMIDGLVDPNGSMKAHSQTASSQLGGPGVCVSSHAGGEGSGGTFGSETPHA